MSKSTNIFSILFFSSAIVLVFGSNLRIISRNEWGARPSKSNQQLKIKPPPYVVIHHSAGKTCNSIDDCKATVLGIQNFHMDTRKWKDIGYNFLVGADGNAYEARGWDRHGAHSPAYNGKSIGICVMGNFQSVAPSAKQLQAVKDLIDYGVQNSKISSDYKLLGHRQADSTACPGNKLFEEIKTWTHFTPNP